MHQKSLKITNTGSVNIAELKIICDGKPTVINNLKTGQLVYATLSTDEVSSLSFEIQYADGKVVRHAPENWVLCSSQEMQIVIEDGGKMYFR